MLFLLGLSLAYLAFCIQAAYAYLHPYRQVPTPEPWIESVRIGDAPAWATPGLAEGKPSSVVFVLAHGYGGTRGTWKALLEDLRKAGIDAVAPAMPGQDASPEKTVGFGRAEARTILHAARWCRKQGARRVVGLGISLGGGATWLASAEDPSALDGVVTDASFAVFGEAMQAAFGRRIPGGATLLWPVGKIAQLMSGIDPATIRPIDAAKAWYGRPALVIQGTADTLIVPENGERLAKAAGCPIWRVEGAEHAEDYKTAPEEYARRVVAFAHQLEPEKLPVK